MNEWASLKDVLEQAKAEVQDWPDWMRSRPARSESPSRTEVKSVPPTRGGRRPSR